eukprot:1196021-Prymnesium_polylepis.2
MCLTDIAGNAAIDEPTGLGDDACPPCGCTCVSSRTHCAVCGGGGAPVPRSTARPDARPAKTARARSVRA